MQGECALCRQKSDLQESHIIPKFVTNWMKRTTPVPRFRSSDSPRRPVQDGAKFHLLCSRCEQRFSQLENEFASKVFYKLFTKDAVDPVQISKGVPEALASEFGRFYLSMLFRVVAVEIVRAQVQPGQMSALLAARDNWGSALLDVQTEPVLLAWIQSEGVQNSLRALGLGHLRFMYSLHTVDWCSHFGKAKTSDEVAIERPILATYVKIPGFAIVGFHGLPEGSLPSPTILEEILRSRLTESDGTIQKIISGAPERQRTAAGEAIKEELSRGDVTLALQCLRLDALQASTGGWIETAP